MLGNRNDNNESPYLFRWHGIADPLNLAANHTELIDKLMFGPRHGLNLEKLAGYQNLYSARLNQGDRMLFTTIEQHGKRILTVCEFTAHYKHANMFKPGVLENFREMHAERLTANTITDKHFVPVSEEELNLPLQTKSHHSDNTQKYKNKNVDFFLQKFIALDDKQSLAVKSEYEDDCKPTVVTGAAGSGKTCIAITMLGEKVEREWQRSQKEGTPVKPVLYVAESDELCRLVEYNWRLSPLAERFKDDVVHIKTYSQMIQDLAISSAQIASSNIVDAAHFYAFIKGSIELARVNKQLRAELGDAFLNDMEKMYKELRIISGYSSLEEYLSQASSHSLLSNDAAKEWLYVRVQIYKDQLAEKQLVDLALYQPSVSDIYAYIIADEAQDFSWGQLTALLKLADKRKRYPQICILEDEQQGFVDLLSKLPFIKELLKAKCGEMNPVELNVAYRCPRAVVDLANKMLEVGSKLSNRAVKYMAAAPAVEAAGITEIFTEFTDDLKKALCVSPPPPGFAVITTEAQKDKAISLFGDVVYTPKEIKGLEFKHIVWYGLMSEEIFYRASKYLENVKAKKFFAEPAERLAFAPAFYALYSACTRATERLTIIEPNQNNLHKLKNLLAELKSVVINQQLSATALSPAKSKEEQAREVIQQIRKLILARKYDKARSFGAAHAVATAEIEAMIGDLSIRTSPAESKTPAVNTVKAPAVKQNASAKLSSHKATMHGRAKSAKKKPAKSRKGNAVTYRDYQTSDLEKLVTEPFNAASYHDLFNHPKINLYLFQTPLFQEGECLFSLLIEMKETRHVMINELIARFDTFLPFITRSALFWKNPGDQVDHSRRRVPPIDYLVMSRFMEFMGKAKGKQLEFWQLLNAEDMAKPRVCLGGNQANHLFLIAMYDPSLNVLHHLVNIGYCERLTPSQLVEVYLIDDTPISLLSTLLNRHEHELKVLAALLKKHKSLISVITLENLHWFDYDRFGEQAAIERLNDSVSGREILQIVEENNPELAHYSLLTLDEGMARQLHKTLRPAILDKDNKTAKMTRLFHKARFEFSRAKILAQTDTPASIICRMNAIKFLRTELETLLISEPNEAYIYLFHIDVAEEGMPWNKSCLFTKLMDQDDTRSLMCLILSDARFSSYLFYHMPVHVLCGTKDNTPLIIPKGSMIGGAGYEQQVFPFPLMWLCGSKDRLATLSKFIYPKSFLSRFIPLNLLTKRIYGNLHKNNEVEKFYQQPEFKALPMPGVGACVATLLLLSDEGRKIVTALCTDSSQVENVFTPEFLLDDNLIDAERKTRFHHLANLLISDDSDEALGLILNKYSPLPMLKLFRQLFACFEMNKSMSDAEAFVLGSMLKHEKTLGFILVNLQGLRSIVKTFDPRYFLPPETFNDKYERPNDNLTQMKLINLMKATDGGRMLFKNFHEVLLKIHTDNHAEQTTQNTYASPKI